MSTGSYDFDTLNDTAFQAERLRQQALAVRTIESSLLRAAGLQSSHDVLEIGSGPGFVSDLLAELASEGSLHAVEPSATLLGQVRGNVSKPPKGGLFTHQAFGNDLPLAEASIDFAYARFVLQHVAGAQAVVDEVHRVLRPGGRFCAVDSDDGLVIFHPQEERVQQLMQKAQAIQQEQGGDRFIGRKIPEMMHAAGFARVTTRIVSLTSSELPFAVLFNILLGYKASLLGADVDMARLHQDLAAEVAAGRRLIAAGVFVVSGEKA